MNSPATQDPKHKADNSYYANVRPEVISLVPRDAQRILDVGCGAGVMGQALKQMGIPYVAGIEYDQQAAQQAAQALDHVDIGDVEHLTLAHAPDSFDVIIYADILEHLINPERTLARHMRYLKPGGIVITSIPNVRYYAVFTNLASGSWTYEESGILDRDHLRFFTIKEMVKMLNGANLEIAHVGETLNEQYEAIKPNEYPATINFGRIALSGLNEFEFRDLFVFQYLIVARKPSE
ncbi:class I SAM-dependent methyltransferase [Magnetofaba australis]|uniref:Putative type 12 methyltransferase n=1 Tax=Magnetofaba australis IT-1 TaxID=1434232 RepID=A0A1Y2K653_9PROT|nr:class I SAM-dependent methyltransferase [Magnetofaba australis]OSM05109.1 putative type 12 methyltransferase [Magnetofaba australis IT-1]